MIASLERIAAGTLLLAAFAAGAWLVVRRLDLDDQARAAEARLRQARDGAAIATLTSIALPASRMLTVCNNTREHLEITALGNLYSDAGGAFHVVNSAREAWHTWQIPAGSRQTLQLAASDASWDGRSLFYAMDVKDADGRQWLQAGIADDLKNGCVPLGAASRGKADGTP